jgi:ABC-type branched-subunit amino acid transport system ATPase component
MASVMDSAAEAVHDTSGRGRWSSKGMARRPEFAAVVATALVYLFFAITTQGTPNDATASRSSRYGSSASPECGMVDQLVGTLSGGERQVIAIGRAMYFGAKVRILDEPTSALGVKEASTVLRFINHAKNQGVGVVIIRHKCASRDVLGRHFRGVNPGPGRRALSARGEEQRRGLIAHGGR